MNKIEKMIQELCPEGVEWRTLGDLGNLYSGLSGKNKESFLKGNKPYVPGYVIALAQSPISLFSL